MGKAGRRNITQKEVIAASKLLDINLVKNETGLWSYINDYTDARVASEVNAELSSKSIGNLRNAAYGRLAPSPKDESNALAAELLDTKAELKLTAAALAELTIRFNKLCEGISAARGNSLDARHLILKNATAQLPLQ